MNAMGFFASAIQPWLSVWMMVAIGWGNPKSESRERSQMASLVAFADAMYSASTVDNVTVGCFFKDHETVPCGDVKDKSCDGLSVGKVLGPVRIHPADEVDTVIF